MEVEIWEWILFFAIVAVVMFLDLFVLNRKSHEVSTKSAVMQTVAWIAIAVIFGIFILIKHGNDAGMSFFAAYVIEESMSVDNLFVFILLFGMFAVPSEYQHKALFWGVFGAIVFRAIFIVAGSALLENFKFMMYIFGVLLVFLALKTMLDKGEGGENKIGKFLSKHLKVSEDFDGDKFFTKKTGVLLATPLFACVLTIELSDIIFALDSVPACLAITTDIFIVYTSNIFAIMGLRSLYFAIHGGLESLRYMKYGLGLILLFVATKMLIAEFYTISIGMSLGVIIGILAITIAASLLIKPKAEDTA